MKNTVSGKERSDIICPTCRHHTVSKLTRHGYVCKECGTVTQRKEPDDVT